MELKNSNRAGQFQPGQSGNPKGRPKKEQSLTNIMREMLDEIRETPGDDKSKKIELKILLVRKMIDMALEGDMTAMRHVFQYIDGMPLQKIELSTEQEFIDALRSEGVEKDDRE
jgi:hypothetical protein